MALPSVMESMKYPMPSPLRSGGTTLVMTVAIKPIPSIGKEQQSVNAEGSPVSLRVGGRHDICAIPRVNPVLEAMAALTVADALLLQRRMG